MTSRAGKQRRLSIGEKAAEIAKNVERKVENALTCMWDDLAAWQKDNHFILSGYRPASSSFARSFHSLFYLHNETINIYTHGLGALTILPLTYYLHHTIAQRFPSATTADILAFGTFLGSAFACLSLSATFHTISNHSHAVAKFGNQLDYLGIIILIAGSFIPSVYYGFRCQPALMKGYWGMMGGLALCCAYVTMNPRFRTPQYRPFRAGMFIGLGVSGVLPVLHGLTIYTYKEMNERMGLNWMLLQGVLYIVGAGLYAARVPERWCPGRFDLLGASHQIFHCFVLVAAASQFRGLVEAFDFVHRRGGGC